MNEPNETADRLMLAVVSQRVEEAKAIYNASVLADRKRWMEASARPGSGLSDSEGLQVVAAFRVRTTTAPAPPASSLGCSLLSARPSNTAHDVNEWRRACRWRMKIRMVRCLSLKRGPGLRMRYVFVPLSPAPLHGRGMIAPFWR